MRQGVEISKLISLAIIPICIWGLVSSLLMYLIEIRSVFVEGGEWRLRQACLAFALGVIFLQRLYYVHGKSVAKPYSFGLGFAITAFCLYFSYTYRILLHPIFVFIINIVLFSVLWWAGHKLSASCSVDSDAVKNADLDTGIIANRIKIKKYLQEKDKPNKKEEKKTPVWGKKLPKMHPGRVVLFFSLIAIPLFSIGLYLFDMNDFVRRFKLGILIFIYMWCALALLFLSSLTQLRYYFEKRDVSLPEQVSIPWLSLGFLLITLVTLLAVFIPQPRSLSVDFVRSRVVSIYKGWESKYGVKESLGGASSKSGQSDNGRQELKEYFDKRYSDIDKMDDKYLSEVRRKSNFESDYQAVLVLGEATKESFKEVFDFFLKVIFVLLIISGLFILYILFAVMFKGLSGSLFHKNAFTKKEKAGIKKKKKLEQVLIENRMKYTDPFAVEAYKRDGNALIRYIWETMTSFSSSYGFPCMPDQTPYEFIGAKPPTLKGFENNADFIAKQFVYSEFSGKSLSESEIFILKKFWSDLQNHINCFFPESYITSNLPSFMYFFKFFELN